MRNWIKSWFANKKKRHPLSPPLPPEPKGDVVTSGDPNCKHHFHEAKWDEERWGKSHGLTIHGQIKTIGSMYVWDKKAWVCVSCGEIRIEETGFTD